MTESNKKLTIIDMRKKIEIKSDTNNQTIELEKTSNGLINIYQDSDLIIADKKQAKELVEKISFFTGGWGT